MTLKFLLENIQPPPGKRSNPIHCCGFALDEKSVFMWSVPNAKEEIRFDLIRPTRDLGCYVLLRKPPYTIRPGPLLAMLFLVVVISKHNQFSKDKISLYKQNEHKKHSESHSVTSLDKNAFNVELRC